MNPDLCRPNLYAMKSAGCKAKNYNKMDVGNMTHSGSAKDPANK